MTFRVWQSDDTVRIEANGCFIELTSSEADALAQKLRPQNHHHHWTGEERTKAIKLYSAELHIRQIARELGDGIIARSVEKIISRAGITRGSEERRIGMIDPRAS